MPVRPLHTVLGFALLLTLAACSDGGAATTTAATVETTSTTVGRTTVQVVITAAAFTPASNDVQYHNNGSDLRAEGALGFYAPIWFSARSVRIEEMTLVAYDPTPDAQLCVSLELRRPFADDETRAGQICTGTGPVMPQIRTLTDLDPRDVDTATEGAYLYAYFDGSDVFLGAVQITYSY